MRAGDGPVMGTSDQTIALREAYALHSEGRLAKAETSYREILKATPDHPYVLFALGTVCGQSNRHDEAKSWLEQAAALDPNNADVFGNLASTYRELNDLPASLLAFQQAHRLAPDRFAFLCGAGATLLLLGRKQEARRALTETVARHPEEAAGWGNLGSALVMCSEPEVAVACLNRALALNPNYADAIYNRGTAKYDLGRFAEAEADARLAIHATAPGSALHFGARMNLGITRIVQGYQDGWSEYEARLHAGRLLGIASTAPQLRVGSNLAGARVLIKAEQGFGDLIQFCRYAKILRQRGAYVILEAHKSLVELLRQANLADQIIPIGDSLPNHDWHVPLMSMPALFGTAVATADKFPYLSAPQDTVAAWRTRLGRAQAKIGLVCSGNPAHKSDALRSTPLATFAPLLDCDAEFYLVQTEVRDSDISFLGRSVIQNLGPELSDFTETAGALSALDLLISVDTSVAHLAGALNLPIWMMLALGPDYRWLAEGETTQWYPSMRLFRQEQLRDFDSLIPAIRQALDSFLSARAA